MTFINWSFLAVCCIEGFAESKADIFLKDLITPKDRSCFIAVPLLDTRTWENLRKKNIQNYLNRNIIRFSFF